MADGYVQVADDGQGKRVGNYAVKLPAGTVVADKDGVLTTLTADTTLFLQRVVLTDSRGEEVDVADPLWRDAMLDAAARTNELLELILATLEK